MEWSIIQQGVAERPKHLTGENDIIPNASFYLLSEPLLACIIAAMAHHESTLFDG